jgi:hypothetical protein
MPRIALLALLALTACSGSEGDLIASNNPDPSGWRLASGKTPTQAEFAALAATCQIKGGAVDSCFTDLGLKRAR